MVCPELVLVTDGFLRDRDRKRAYPLPPPRPGLDRKSSRVQGFRDPADPADPQAIGAGLHRGGIAPVENSVISRQLLGFGVPGIRITGDIGPNVARFLVSQIGLDCSPAPYRTGTTAG